MVQKSAKKQRKILKNDKNELFLMTKSLTFYDQQCIDSLLFYV